MRSRHPIQNMTAFIKLLKNNKDIDIIHIHNFSPVVCIDTIIALIMGIRVRIAHSRSAPIKKIFMHSFFSWVLKRSSTLLLACSTEAGNYMFGKRAYKSKKFRLFPNARPLADFRLDISKRLQIRKEMHVTTDYVAVHIARFNEVKNQMFLIDIIKEASKQIRNLKLFMVGDGEMREDLEAYVEQLGLDNVIFLGFRKDISNLMQMADIMLLPSFYEGLPGIAIEAQAASLPSILSETITKEVKLTKILYFCDINNGVNPWIEQMFTMYKQNMRDNYEDCYQQIKDSGYDILEASKKLLSLYLNSIENII